MKKVVFNRPEEFIHVDDLSDADLIGVEFNNGARGFVQRIEHSHYIVSRIKNNEGYTSKVSSDSIKGILNRVGSVNGAFVFEYDKDLAKWLYEAAN